MCNEGALRLRCPRVWDSLNLCNPEVALGMLLVERNPAGHLRTEMQKRIILKLDDYAAWKTLHNNTFEPNEPFPAVVFEHANACAPGVVEVLKAVFPRRRTRPTWWTPPAFAVEGRIAEVAHGFSFSTSWN